MAQKFGAVVTLKDNFSATLRGIQREQKRFKKDVSDARKELEKTFKKKYEAKLNATAASKKIKQLRKDLEPLKKKIITAVAYKDMIANKILATKNKLKTLGKMSVQPIVKIKDATANVLGGIKNKLINLKTLAATMALGVGTAAMLKSGAQLEQQQISMQHFIGKGNPQMSEKESAKTTDKFMKQLRKNANETPFETGEVLAAGTRAVGISGGSIKEAMELVKVAEDMAALTPGKTVSDAMESLADAKNGEMERLKEFNAKVSADEYKELGFKGVVDKKLKTQFEGGAGKLAGSGAGMFSTITGTLKSAAQDTGLQMLEKLKPSLQDTITFIDSIAPKLQSFGTKIAEGFGVGINFIRNNMPQIKSAIQELSPVLDLVRNSVSLVVNAFRIGFPAIKTVIQTAWKVIKPLIEGIAKTIGAVSSALSKIGVGGGKGKGKEQTTGKRMGGSSENALGTPYYSGGTVDERGGEIKVLPNGSKVIPHDVSVKAMQGNKGGNTINININGSNLSIDQIVNEMADKIDLALANM